MAAVYTIIVFLVGIVPLLILDSGAFFQALILAVTAIAIMLLAVNIRVGDLARLAGLLGPSAAVAALPGLWMVLQLLPLPGLAHPIWTSAAAALNRPMAGTVSIDTGATLLAFARYCGLLAIGCRYDRRGPQSVPGHAHFFRVDGNYGLSFRRIDPFWTRLPRVSRPSRCRPEC